MTQIGLGKLQGRIQSRNRKITLTWRCWSASDLSECDLALGRNVFAQPRPTAVIARIEIPQCSGLPSHGGVLSFEAAAQGAQRLTSIQNISGLPQGRGQPFGGTLIVR